MSGYNAAKSASSANDANSNKANSANLVNSANATKPANNASSTNMANTPNTSQKPPVSPSPATKTPAKPGDVKVEVDAKKPSSAAKFFKKCKSATFEIDGQIFTIGRTQ